MCKGALRRIPPDCALFFTLLFAAFAADSRMASLTQECAQRSAIGLRAVKKSASVEKKLTKPAEPVFEPDFKAARRQAA
jgi:hypothetical protein